MNHQQATELAELHLRVIATTVEATHALYRNPLDMGEMARTADNEQDARREFWQALYSVEKQDAATGYGNVRTVASRAPKRR